MVFQINHAHNHGASRVERKLLKTPSCVESAQGFVERMRDDGHAADGFGYVHRRSEREGQKLHAMALFLIILVDGQLAKQQSRHLFRAVALQRLGKERADIRFMARRGRSGMAAMDYKRMKADIQPATLPATLRDPSGCPGTGGRDGPIADDGEPG